MKKRLICFFVVVSILLNFTTNISAGNVVSVETYDLTNLDRSLSVRGKMPIIKSVGENFYEFKKEINDKIINIRNEKIDEAIKDDAVSISFDYKKVVYNDIASVLIYTVTTFANSSKIEVRSVNFDVKHENYIAITDVLGVNAIELINKFVAQTIKQNPSKFNTEFKGVSKNINFYVDNGECVILFDQFEIAPGYNEVVELPMKLSDVHNVLLTRKDYIVDNDSYNLKLVPLRQVAEGLGYNVTWDNSDKSTLISKGSFSTKIYVGKNKYNVSPNTDRELESAPSIDRNTDKVYLPISFFGAVLGVTYKVDDDDNIFFSQYKNK